jgi:CheY-like chemotaxis protein
MFNVLIAEDTPTWSNLLTDIIHDSAEGVSVEVAVSAREALYKIDHHDPYDLVIVDKNISPDERNISEWHGGFAVINKANELFPGTYIMMVTGEPFNEAFLQSMQSRNVPVNAFADKNRFNFERFEIVLQNIQKHVRLPDFVFLDSNSEENWGEHFPRAVEFWQSQHPTGKEMM